MDNEESNTVKPLLSESEYTQAPLTNAAPLEFESVPYANGSRTYLPQNETQNETQTQTQFQAQPQTQTQTQCNSNNSGQPFIAAVFPTVEVVAPATLSTGYTFDAMVDGRVLTIIVPSPGVTEGQVFEAQTKAPMDESPEVLQVPEGFWKDGLWDFCRFGPVHPSIVLACCCPLVALGQITTRLGLKWDGEPATNPNQSKWTFRLFLALSVAEIFIPRLFKWIFLTFVALVAARVRSHIRGRYSLPPTMEKVVPRDNRYCSFSEDRYVAEDYCLPMLCAPCAISQMGRHTAMYETYEGRFMSATGLPPHVPLMV